MRTPRRESWGIKAATLVLVAAAYITLIYALFAPVQS